jgi:hypothetical protein
MPALSFLAFVGLALIAFLFYGNATLEAISPETVTTHYAVAPAQAPNMTSQVALQPEQIATAMALTTPRAVAGNRGTLRPSAALSLSGNQDARHYLEAHEPSYENFRKDSS